MPPCLSAKGLLLVSHRDCARCVAGGPRLRWFLRVGELSDGPAAPIPSPVLSCQVSFLEAEKTHRSMLSGRSIDIIYLVKQQYPSEKLCL